MNKTNAALGIAIIALLGLVVHALYTTPPAHALLPSTTLWGRLQRMLPGAPQA